MLPELVCPLCRVPLGDDRDGVRCAGCGRVFPSVAGILDLRVAGDPYLSLDDDREKARALAGVDGGFEDVLRAYWDRTPEVPRELADRYIANALAGARRAGRHLETLDVRDRSLLDVGCGTGGLLVAAAERGAHPVGVDIALRWLVVAQRHLRKAGRDVPLVAADGALLPFRAGSFEVVTCIETLEHATDQRGTLHGCLAVARSGTMHVVTANRFSVLPEPTAALWGVGFLPRRLAVPYVAWQRGTRYDHFRPLSASSVHAVLGPGDVASVAPAPLPAPPQDASRSRKAVTRAYDAVRRWPLVAGVLRWVGPYLEVRSP